MWSLTAHHSPDYFLILFSGAKTHFVLLYPLPKMFTLVPADVQALSVCHQAAVQILAQKIIVTSPRGILVPTVKTLHFSLPLHHHKALFFFASPSSLISPLFHVPFMLSTHDVPPHSYILKHVTTLPGSPFHAQIKGYTSIFLKGKLCLLYTYKIKTHQRFQLTN